MDCIEAKVVVLGAQGVGKTSVVMNYMGDAFNKHASPTIGASFFTCKMCLNNQNIKLQIWDTAGQERFRAMAPMYYRNANAALVVYELTSTKSFEDMKSWVQELQKNVDDKIRIVMWSLLCVIGNKCDLWNSRRITKEMGMEFASQISACYFETSAVTGEGISDVFVHIAEKLVKRLEAERNSPPPQSSSELDSDKSVKLSGNPEQPHGKGACCS